MGEVSTPYFEAMFLGEDIYRICWSATYLLVYISFTIYIRACMSSPVSKEGRKDRDTNRRWEQDKPPKWNNSDNIVKTHETAKNQPRATSNNSVKVHKRRDIYTTLLDMFHVASISNLNTGKSSYFQALRPAHGSAEEPGCDCGCDCEGVLWCPYGLLCA